MWCFGLGRCYSEISFFCHRDVSTVLGGTAGGLGRHVLQTEQLSNCSCFLGLGKPSRLSRLPHTFARGRNTLGFMIFGGRVGIAKARSCSTPVQGRRDSQGQPRDSRNPCAPEPASSAACTKGHFVPWMQEKYSKGHIQLCGIASGTGWGGGSGRRRGAQR